MAWTSKEEMKFEKLTRNAAGGIIPSSEKSHYVLISETPDFQEVGYFQAVARTERDVDGNEVPARRKRQGFASLRIPKTRAAINALDDVDLLERFVWGCQRELSLKAAQDSAPEGPSKKEQNRQKDSLIRAIGEAQARGDQEAVLALTMQVVALVG